MRSRRVPVLALALTLFATPALALPWDEHMPTIRADCLAQNFTNILGVPLLSGTVRQSIIASIPALMPGVVKADPDAYNVASAMAYGGCGIPAKPPSVVAWEAAWIAAHPPAPPVDVIPPVVVTGPAQPVVLDNAGAPATDTRLAWNPIKRALCIGMDDAACASVWWPGEGSDTNPPLLLVTGGKVDGPAGYGDVSNAIIQQSEIPNDPRALACLNLFARNGLDVGQVCQYGQNYPESPFRDRMKLGCYGRGCLFNIYDAGGTLDFAANGNAFASMNARGFGIGAGAATGIHVFSLGWGTMPSTVADGEVACIAKRVNGVAEIVCQKSTGAQTCVTC